MVRLNLVDGLLMGYSGRRSLLNGMSSAAEAAADDGEGGEVGIDTELAESVILLDGVEIDEDFFPDGGGADGPIPSKSGAVGYCCDGQSPDGTSCAAPGSVSRCVHPLYGRPVPPAEAEELIGPDRDGGLIWRAHLLPDDFAGPIKARRGKAFPVRSSDFFSSLVRIGGRGDPNADLSDSVKTAESADLDDEEGGAKRPFSPTSASTSAPSFGGGHRLAAGENRRPPPWPFLLEAPPAAAAPAGSSRARSTAGRA